MDEVRREEKTHYFRADRVFAINDRWYFSSRECDEGPYATRREAEKALQAYLRRVQKEAGYDKAPETLSSRLLDAFHDLQNLQVLAAWRSLSSLAQELGLDFHPRLHDLYACCEQVLQHAERLHHNDDPRVSDLSAALRRFSHRHSARAFPADGMLVPGLIYRTDHAERGVFYSKISELGDLVVISARGRREELALTSMPLDATEVVADLIARLQKAAAGSRRPVPTAD